jgi:hypothetical protein
VLGVIISASGLARENGVSRIEKFHFAEMGWVIGAVVVYGLLLKPAGALVSIVALLLAAAALLVIVMLAAIRTHREGAFKEAD